MSAQNGSAASAPSPRLAEAEQLLRSLNGILLARIVTDDHGHFVEIHLVGDDDAEPERLERNAQSALLARYGAFVPLDRIHLLRLPAAAKHRNRNGHAPPAATGDDAPAAGDRAPFPRLAPAPAPRRAATPELVSIEIERSREQRIHCRLALRCEGRIVHGEADTLDAGAATRLEAAARAAVAALNATGAAPALELEGARVCDIAGRAYATAALRTPHARGIHFLAGAAPITDSAEDAAALAAVQAASQWFQNPTARPHDTATAVR